MIANKDNSYSSKLSSSSIVCVYSLLCVFILQYSHKLDFSRRVKLKWEPKGAVTNGGQGPLPPLGTATEKFMHK